MGRSPLLGPWPDWVPKDSTPSLIPCERNDADSEAEDLLKIDYQSLPSPPEPAIFPMDATIFNFGAVLEDALSMSRFRDHLRRQKYGSEGMESKPGYTPEHLRERWREKLRKDEEDLLRSIYDSDPDTDESDRDPMETSEDREKKRQSRLVWASPKTKVILDKMGIKTLGGPDPNLPSFPPSLLPDPTADAIQPAATHLTEAQPDTIHPHARLPPLLDHQERAMSHSRLLKRLNGEPDEPKKCNTEEDQPVATLLTEIQPDSTYLHAQTSPLPLLSYEEWARAFPRLRKRLNGEPDEPEKCNADPGLDVSASDTGKAMEPAKVLPFEQGACPHTDARKDAAKGFEDSNGIPVPDVATSVTKSEEMSQNDTTLSPRIQTSQLQSPPLSITPGSWVEEDPNGKAGKKRSHNDLSEPLLSDSAIHPKRRRWEAKAPGLKRRRLEVEAYDPGLEADRSRTLEIC
ncbi:hypothetical protein MMC30_007832 [Trapelia coarctata]|nr:hypothetical protein [Trapelia coarctata]